MGQISFFFLNVLIVIFILLYFARLTPPDPLELTIPNNFRKKNKS